MSRFRCALFSLVFLALAAPATAQVPDATVLAELGPGVHVRANGPAVRELFGPRLGDILGLNLVALVAPPPATGVVVAADAESLRVGGPRRRMVTVPWEGIDFVDVHRGRSAPLGAAQGTGLGALSGLALWGLIELAFLKADNPVIEEPWLLVAPSMVAGAAWGAMTMGDRWERVYTGHDRD